MSEPVNERTVRVALRIHDDMYQKLCKVSAHMGIPASTIGAIALAEYVNKKLGEAEYLTTLAQKNAEVGKDGLKEIFSDPAKYQEMFKMVAGLVGVEPIEKKDE